MLSSKWNTIRTQQVRQDGDKILLAFAVKNQNYSCRFDAQRGSFMCIIPDSVQKDWHVRFTPPTFDSTRRGTP
jgi:hypothetical protein